MSVFGKSLTRQEWNAAYFLGSEEGRFRGALAAQVRRGIEILGSSGYMFEVQALLEGGGRLGDWPALPDEHERACLEMKRGDFDTSGRAREALRWLKDTAPEIDPTWVERKSAERHIHAECPPRGGATRAHDMALGGGVGTTTAHDTAERRESSVA